MTPEQFEEILEGAGESQKLEFKGPCGWSDQIFAKHILALSNVRDGGVIVVGVEDGTLKRLGLTKEQKATFDPEIMKDQLSTYADPHVRFDVDFPSDKSGLMFVVIRVFEFEEIPVICKKMSSSTRDATLYYRNKNKRPESGPISNSYDLRNIIELATVKMMQHKKELGFEVEPGAKQKFDEELDGL